VFKEVVIEVAVEVIEEEVAEEATAAIMMKVEAVVIEVVEDIMEVAEEEEVAKAIKVKRMNSFTRKKVKKINKSFLNKLKAKIKVKINLL
jgi:hypothetical protein